MTEAEGDPCPNCGRTPKLLVHPLTREPYMVIGGAGRCRCREIEESQRIEREALARQRTAVAEAFWRTSQFGDEFRQARLDGLTGWDSGMMRAVEAGKRLLEAGAGGLLLFGPPGIGKS
ncbi:MAG: hypothetical protein Q8R28_07115, partial [Dehalococcoidia bacterium]|nr:hypothetical protein [Dehalococcoidia bacterium]